MAVEWIDARESSQKHVERNATAYLKQLAGGKSAVKAKHPCLSQSDNLAKDLSSLNTYLHIPSFKMKTAKIVQESLDQGQWMTSIDLPDA